MGDLLELNRAVPGGRVEMFAIGDHDYPGDWFYRSSFYNQETGEILRYDNAHHDDDLGWHHRHVSFGENSEIDSDCCESVPDRPPDCGRSYR